MKVDNEEIDFDLLVNKYNNEEIKKMNFTEIRKNNIIESRENCFNKSDLAKKTEEDDEEVIEFLI